MLGSFHIGKVAGIQVRMHWTFPALILFLMLVSHWHPLIFLGFCGLLFGIVFLHELGHSLVARRFGLRVLDITFWPLGGMARMSEIPESSRVEAWIAIAGPLVNLALAALSLPALIGVGMIEASGLEWLHATLLFFVSTNLVLGLFNLIPAFPMDGGRILRAWLGRRGDWLGATERAVRIGRYFAVAMVVFGVWNPVTGQSQLVLALIGLFVWLAGTRELFAVRMRHAPSRIGVFGNAYKIFQAWSEATARSQAARRERQSSGDASGAFAQGPAPEPASSTAPSGQWTDERVAELERFRGPLRHFPETR